MRVRIYRIASIFLSRSSVRVRVTLTMIEARSHCRRTLSPLSCVVIGISPAAMGPAGRLRKLVNETRVPGIEGQEDEGTVGIAKSTRVSSDHCHG